MKAWFDFSLSWLYEDFRVYLGVTAHFHKRKEWKGFTVSFLFYKWALDFTAVTNFPEYDRVVLQRRYGKPKK